MFNKKVLAVSLFSLCAVFTIGASPLIEAEIDDVLYDEGEIITVRINLSDNPGIKGLFFDLSYDSQKLSYLDLSEGLLLQRISESNKLLYAHTDGQTALSLGGHVVVSWFLEEKDAVSLEEGTFVELRFRVKERGFDGETFQFQFSNNSVTDSDNTPVSEAVWQDSPSFTLDNTGDGFYVDIRVPRNHEVFHTDTINLDALYSPGVGYTLLAENQTTAYISSQIDGISGSLEDEIIPLVEGPNRVSLALFDNIGAKVAEDEINLIKSSDDQFIKIISPINHSLLNTNMVKVIVSSSFENPQINGLPMESLNETDPHKATNTLYFKNYYLKEGFNSIEAEVLDGEAIYKSSISIYYHKDDSVFSFVTPGANSVVKIADDAEISIKGEISSRIDDDYNENTVHVQAIYYPRNKVKKNQKLVDMKLAQIKETDLPSRESTASYIFVLEDNIPIGNLESGTIELTAYKNKRGTSADDVIHRTFYIDNDRLYIDLVQPNIHTTDFLDSETKVAQFNNGPPEKNGMIMNREGAFTLDAQENIFESIADFQSLKISDIIRTSEGDLFALINDSNKLKIYKQAFGEQGWEPVLEKGGVYGYDLCETDLGLLVGVSHHNNTDQSGLYLLQSDSLINISIGEPIPHVQFISEEDGLVSLYGNSYSYLYTFNIFSLGDNNGLLTAGITSKYPFDNSFFIKDFKLTSGGRTAVIHTLGNDVFFYRKGADNSFKSVFFQGNGLEGRKIEKVVSGEYSDGDYNAYLLLVDENTALVVMEHRENQRFILNHLQFPFTDNEVLAGIDFYGNQFSIATYNAVDNGYKILRRQILFDSLYGEEELEYSPPPIPDVLPMPDPGDDLALLQVDTALFFTGFSSESPGLVGLRAAYPDDGYVEFLYNNPDIEGLVSFDFEIESTWIESDSALVKFGFAIGENGNLDFGTSNVLDNSVQSLTIKEMIEEEKSDYKVYRQVSNTDGNFEVITVEFSDIQPNTKNLYFKFDLKPSGGTSPIIRNLAVTKKIPVKLPRNGEEEVILPIHGYIYDPTVEFIKIGTNPDTPVVNGIFSENIRIETTSNQVEILLHCINGAYETATLGFTVQLFDSENSISDVILKDNEGNFLSADQGYKYSTNKSEIKVSGSYTGLLGAVVGYEIRDVGNDNLIKSGIFESDDSSIVVANGYEDGSFTDQSIALIPDEQVLNIYVENPGGLRSIYRTTDGERPVVNYDLPLSSQEIALKNFEIQESDSVEIVEGIKFDRMISMIVNEDPFTNVFRTEINIRGQVLSKYTLQNLRVKSYDWDRNNDSGIYFVNEEDEILVKVDNYGRFEVRLMVVLPEEMESDVYKVAFIPEAPFLHELSRGLIVNVEKSFANTNIVPEFTGYMDSWSDEEIRLRKKPVRVKIERYIPEGAEMVLHVNYQDYLDLNEMPFGISGTLVEIADGLYKLMNGLDEVSLVGVKLGQNRLQWWINYKNQTISTSAAEKTGMEDFLFTLSGDNAYVDTAVDFPIVVGTYYDSGTIPQITLTKDVTTDVDIFLNDVLLAIQNIESGVGVDLSGYQFVEGKNKLVVEPRELDRSSQVFEYEFLFDSLDPAVQIADYTYDSSNPPKLTSLSALATDYNLKDVVIRYGNPFNPSEYNVDPEYTYIGDGRFNVYWDLSSVSLSPTSLEPLFVLAYDHAGKVKTSVAFNGLLPLDEISDGTVVTAIDLDYKYRGIPFSQNWGGTAPFEESGIKKFYPNGVIIKDFDVTGDYRIDSPYYINLGSGDGSQPVSVASESGNLAVNAGGSVRIYPGFSVEQGSTVSIGIDSSLYSYSVHLDQVDFSHESNLESMSIAFYYRYEHEEIYDDYSIPYDGEYKRILTLLDYWDEDAKKGELVYLATKYDGSNPLSADLFIVRHQITRRTSSRDDDPSRTVLNGDDPLTVRHGGPYDGWNLIVLSVDGTQEKFSLSLNGEAREVFDDTSLPDNFLNLNIYDEILKDNTLATEPTERQHYFGNFHSGLHGHFSIAQPFYVNRVITADEVPELENQLSEYHENLKLNSSREYNFDNASDDIGDNFDELKISAGSGDAEDHFTALENVDYTDPGKGALFARSEHKNYLSAENNILRFADSDEPSLHNVHAFSGWMWRPQLVPITRLELLSEGTPGRYYFSKQKGSNHGLTNNKYFSVFGTVALDGTRGNPDKEAAWMVLKINGEEQRKVLRTGQFHLVFDNSKGITPELVELYIETTDTIILQNDFVLTEGDYILPPEAVDGLAPLRAEIEYTFGPTGTVDLWYKPININGEGFASYPVTILDSDYITLYTEVVEGVARYRAKIKGSFSGGSAPAIELDSMAPVTSGWQHLQLSYNLPEEIAYLYVDGKIVSHADSAPVDSAFPDAPSMQNYYPARVPVAIGGSLTHGVEDRLIENADGFIDSVRFTRTYEKSLYSDNAPFSYTYSQSQVYDADGASRIDASLDIERHVSISAEDVMYSLTSRDGSFSLVNQNGEGDEHGFDINSLPSGAYNFAAKMNISGYRFLHRFSFIKNDRPNFVVNSATPLIVRGVNSNIEYGIRFDDSYLLQSDDGLYAGFALQLRGKREAEFTRTVYVYQDADLSWASASEENYTDYGRPSLDVIDNELKVVFNDILSLEDIEWELKSFYFSDFFASSNYNFDEISSGKEGYIPLASFTVEENNAGNKDAVKYKLIINIGNGQGSLSADQLNAFSIGTRVRAINDSEKDPWQIYAMSDAQMDLFYDDIFPNFGEYECDIALLYNEEIVDSKKLFLTWLSTENTYKDAVTTEKYLHIEDFALLYLDEESKDGEVQDMARLYLEYAQSAIEGALLFDITVYSTQNGDDFTKYYEMSDQPITSSFNTVGSFAIISGIPVPENDSFIVLSLYEWDEDLGTKNLVQNAELQISNNPMAPEVVITNTVPSRIAYNNVLFTWKGFHDGAYNPNVKFSYNFDRQGWTAWSNDWTTLELFDLDEGYHIFEVKGVYDGVESVIQAIPFFVDVNKPVFDESQILVLPVYESDGIIKSVNITGNAGSVTDISLSNLFINGERVLSSDDGSFETINVEIRKDGLNEVQCSAYDEVGNVTDFVISINNAITDILFPNLTENVLYAPATLVGTINADITSDIEIYLADPESGNGGITDFSDWKKAKINSDGVFFVEDVYINPGSAARTNETTLTLAVRTESGLVYTKDIKANSNELIIPIEMEFSSHAVEGENAPTEVRIDSFAHVNNISSWSIDYTGDGIYDDIVTVDNPLLAKEQSWTHTYSSLGLVTPRVRVITADGNYFSVSDQIIIHEQIMESSNLLVNNPISLSSIRLEDGTDRVYVLAGFDNSYRIEVFEIGRNDNYISEKLYSISLDGLGIENPVRVLALDDEHIFVASNRAGSGYVYLLEANEFGNFINVENKAFAIPNPINDMEADDYSLYITVTDSNYIARLELEGKVPVDGSLELLAIENGYLSEVGNNLALARKNDGIIVADYDRNRILSLYSESIDSESMDPKLMIADYYDDFGSGEREFQRPALIESTENRIFVFDEVRKDIQVFDSRFNSVATLKYTAGLDNNYMESASMDDLKDMSIVTRNEGHRLFYYSLMISGSTNKLSMIRLPQWEELRAGVRNNKIVFLNDREILTAKPNGSDLTRILSSDSIPRIEGTLDYPAISPDGRKIVFTSRVELYDGNGEERAEGNQYAYDNLYMVDVTGENLTRIPLGMINNFEIERPVFSSNGDKIICSAKESGGNWQIYIYNMKSGGVSKLFESDENARFPYYSPDDRYVVFTTDYDGDEEIVIVDVENINMRIEVTSNNSRDSYPVWSTLYPFEISNTDLDIDSKIAFVSERNFTKTTYFSYISRPSESDVRIVKKTGEEIGSSPDLAAMEITAEAADEADYPSFTGDGKSVVFEYQKDWESGLLRYDFIDDASSAMNLPAGARKPGGMKNMIVEFDVERVNGDDLILTWTPYTDNDIFYTVQFKLNTEGANYVEKKFFTSSRAVLYDLEMGSEYLMRVCIIENDEEAATSQWKEVIMPVVAASATVTVDEDNPYLVHLEAWKPNEGTQWQYSWIIDNQEIEAGPVDQYLYEFSTSGTKTIALKAYDKSRTNSDVSEAVSVSIISDIKPAIEYTLAHDSSYVELSAESSLGEKIDWSSAKWIISGPGQPPLPPVTGSQVIVPVDIFSRKINVNLTLTRIPVNNQSSTDVIEKNITIDLDFKDVKPVITYEVNESDSRMFIFSGFHSIGNIDWHNARWAIFGDGVVLHQQQGASSISYRFGEDGRERTYSVSLTVPRISDGKSETTTQIVSVEPAPIEPVIDYEIITLEENGDTIGAKVLFSSGNSKGSSIDFSTARWSVPIAGTYGEQPTQIGPTALYNLFNVDGNAQVEVSLTLSRRGGTDVKTVTERITIRPGNISRTKIIVKKNTEVTSSGYAVVLDALSSTGPNINWENIQWLLDGQYSRTGPVARYDLPQSGEEQIVRYVCTISRYGDTPIVDQGEIIVGSSTIKPLIDVTENLGNNTFTLSVSKTEATNVDWGRTTWYIFDGNENVVQKQGANILHTFVPKSEAMGYPVMVEMFFINDNTPFMGYKTVDIEGDELKPIITWDLGSGGGDANVINFSAQDSLGSGIDWSQTKWTFGDSSETQFGASVVHKYATDSRNREYKVSLTLTRRNTNGAQETATVYKSIDIASDEIKPVLKATLHGDGLLVLSAEDSEGRGLMLDRTTWLFEGEGDSSNISNSQQMGIVSNSSMQIHQSGTVGIQGGASGVVATTTTGISGTFGLSLNNTTNKNESFSTSNSHTGATCRRYVGDDRYTIVTMFVYRVGAEGTMTGKSITVKVDNGKARSSNGVRYE